MTTTKKTSVTAKLAALRRILKSYESVLVAFSGGVDSSFLLYVAARTLDTRCVALTTESPTNSPEELAEARAFASALGVRHVVRRTDELKVPGYADNPPNRCYLCKQTLYPVCFEEAGRAGLNRVVDGVNQDDLSDYRPGLRAAAELGVSHPLVDAELSKAEIRELSRLHSLPTAQRPASPCLSSRFPYGMRITRERLQQVAQAEAGVRRLGFVELRVRHLGERARVELSAAEISRIADSALRREIEEAVKRAGFAAVEVSDQPLRSGSLNDALRR